MLRSNVEFLVCQGDLDREAAMIHHFAQLADCVSKHGGTVCLYSNEAEMTGTEPCPTPCYRNPARILRLDTFWIMLG